MNKSVLAKKKQLSALNAAIDLEMLFIEAIHSKPAGQALLDSQAHEMSTKSDCNTSNSISPAPIR
jgi:hypothetical protein